MRRSPVFSGLVRPPKFLGLPVAYLVVLMLGTALPLIWTGSLWFLLVGAAVYVPLWFVSEREPRFFDILAVSQGAVRSKGDIGRHGGPSYAP